MDTMGYFFVPPCGNCIQPYDIKKDSQSGHIPLLLSCGCTFCSSCVSQTARLQHNRNITCPQCKKSTPLSQGVRVDRQLPPNLVYLGLITARGLGLVRVPEYLPHSPVSISAQLKENLASNHGNNEDQIKDTPIGTECSTALCDECPARAKVKCIQCDGLYCDPCFPVVHSRSVSLRKHTSVPITLALSTPTTCHAHPRQPHTHYCQIDNQLICADCAVSGDHGGHDIVSVAEAAVLCRDKLTPVLSSATTTLKRMRKIEKSLEGRYRILSKHLSTLTEEILTSFAHLHTTLQLREGMILGELGKAFETYSQSLKTSSDVVQVHLSSLLQSVKEGEAAIDNDYQLAEKGDKLISQLINAHLLPQALEKSDDEPIGFEMDEISLRKLLLEAGEVAFVPEYTGLTLLNQDGEPISDDYMVCPEPSTSTNYRRPPSVANSHSKVHSESYLKRASRSATPTTSKGGRSITPISGRSSRSPSVTLIPVNTEDTIEVTVTHVESAGEFYVQTSEQQSKLTPLMAELNQHCAAAREGEGLKQLTRSDIYEGFLCAALFTVDNAWYRATVEGYHGDNLARVTVYYIDFGNSENVSLESLTLLPPSLFSHVPLCLRCSLANVVPTGHAYTHGLAPCDWSRKANRTMTSLVNQSPIKMKILDYSPSGDLAVDLYTQSTGSSFTSISAQLVSMGVAIRGKRKWVESDIPPSVTLATGDMIDVTVPVAENPWDFYVHSDVQEVELDMLSQQLQRSVSLGQMLPLAMPHKGMICCSQYSQDGQWYRGRIIDTGPQGVRVHFIDFGNDEVVPTSLSLGSKFIQLRAQANHCSLYNVIPVDGGQKWPEEVSDFFNDTVGGPLFKMIVKGVAGKGAERGGSFENPLIVELTDKESGLDLAEMLVTLGMACYKSPPRSDVSSIDSITPTPTPPPQSHTSTPHTIPPPLVPKEGDIVPCTVTQVTDPGNFNICVHNDKNKKLLRELKDLVVKEISLPSYNPGDVCLARFHGVKGWHRALVMDVSRNKFKVRYVDYGDTKHVDAECVTSIPPSLLQCPALAIKCSLVGIQRTESAEATHFFYNFVTANVTARVHGTKDNGTVLVSLTNLNRGDVATAMVATGHAHQSADQDHTTPAAKYPLRPESPGDQFVMRVTYIENDVVFGQLLNEETVELLSKVVSDVEMECDGAPPLTSVDNLMVEASCCARYHGDGLWYRARVTKIDKPQNRITVFFIDYGNSEDLKTKDIVTCTPHLDVPPFAIATTTNDMENVTVDCDYNVMIEPGASSYPPTATLTKIESSST